MQAINGIRAQLGQLLTCLCLIVTVSNTQALSAADERALATLNKYPKLSGLFSTLSGLKSYCFGPNQGDCRPPKAYLDKLASASRDFSWNSEPFKEGVRQALHSPSTRKIIEDTERLRATYLRLAAENPNAESKQLYAFIIKQIDDQLRQREALEKRLTQLTTPEHDRAFHAKLRELHNVLSGKSADADKRKLLDIIKVVATDIAINGLAIDSYAGSVSGLLNPNGLVHPDLPGEKCKNEYAEARAGRQLLSQWTNGGDVRRSMYFIGGADNRQAPFRINCQQSMFPRVNYDPINREVNVSANLKRNYRCTWIFDDGGCERFFFLQPDYRQLQKTLESEISAVDVNAALGSGSWQESSNASATQ